MSISAENLSIARGSRRVLSNVSFTLSAGDCLIVEGTNGVGKTSLLRVLAGFSAPQGGVLHIQTEECVYLGHLDAIKPNETVQENLAFWSSLYESKAEIDLGLLGLTGLSDRLAGRLSAGQKRRLGLARILLSNARNWILDEPTTSLDKNGREMVAKLIQRHCETGGIAVLSTHLEIGIDFAKRLDLNKHRAHADETDPFLEGAF